MMREPLEKKFLKPFHMIREKENIIEICLIMHTDKWAELMHLHKELAMQNMCAQQLCFYAA